ncbi:MAG: Na+/H+ antiporter subunit E [Anaerolineae bacterium]|nr:Na+/H+ antiporter subunit E [Anaerolineae bacterium]MCO5191104.1 Na+/H+ antiporter subunit E [Anaerolineae bacterium]MCO5193714.1 Na+/H+ antiporter subunit E [Anaerolineae bacterium]MCO5196703.1 Na+/H+ antiporter subunit E [Anaerolineae bacterium]MCO5206809.1 Na+/H+ antiporter subunit E [Anaerolineae bacterium]
MFALNLLFALVWIALTGEATVSNFIFGFIISFGMLYIVQRTIEPRERALSYFRRVFAAIDLILYFIWTVITANLRMFAAVLLPMSRLDPAIIRVPLSLEDPTAITLLANWITLTPGTLSLDVSDEFDALFIHTIVGGKDVTAFRDEIKQQYERRVMRVFE